MSPLRFAALASSIRLSLSVKVFLVLLATCLFSTHAAAESIHITDDLGRTIVLKQFPSRIVSLAPSVTEILFELGLEREIVGVTSFCNYPPQAKTKVAVGGPMNPNLEKLVSLNPDVIIAARGIYHPELVSQLEQLGLPVFVSDPATIDSILVDIGRIGDLTGKQKESGQLIEKMRRKIRMIQGKVENEKPRRVLYLLWHDPLMTIGPGSYLHELIELAGGQNIFSERGMPYTRLSMEEVISKDPEIIIFHSDLGPSVISEQKTIWRKRWGMVTAVNQGRFHTAPSDLILRPGPRIVDGLDALARTIHPEVYDAGTGDTHD